MLSRIAQAAVSALIPVFIVLFLLICSLFYPGVLDMDSTGIMLEHKYGYVTWHSVVLSYFWGLLQRVWVGPPLLFLLVQLTFLISIFLIVLRGIDGSTRRQMAALLIVLHPLTLAALAYLGKDTIAAVLMAAACAAILWIPAFHRNFRRNFRWLAFGAAISFLVLAACVRTDVLFSAAPLAAGASYLAFDLHQHRLRIRLLVGLAVWVLIGVLSLGLSETMTRLLNAERQYPIQVTLTFDLAGIAAHGGSVRLPDWHGRRNVDTQTLLDLYSPVDTNPMFWATHRTPVPLTKSRQDMEQLVGAWREAVLANPIAYLRHRADFVQNLLGINPQPQYFLISWHTVHGLDNPDQFHARFMRSRFLVLVESCFLALYRTPLLRPWLFTLILVAALVFAISRRSPHRTWIVAVSLSGLIQVAVMSFAAASAILRYLFWADMSAIILATVLLIGWRTRQSATP
ncbi:MAG: hypothetical protein IT168_29725 [Bryobacterales bacterium]|nr:hypothetical protein [Bryobacterales bacterium]